MGVATRKFELSRFGTVRTLAVMIVVGCTIVAAFASARADWGDWSRLDADPPLVDFGNQSTGSTSAPRKVTVSNHSDKTRTIMAVRTTAGFGEGNNCGVLKPRASCQIQVTFSPTSAGKKLGALIIRVADRDNDSGTVVVLAGTGTKAAGLITLSGAATQGAMNGATVSIFSVNASNGLNSGSALATTITDSSGNFTLKLASLPTGPMRLTATGGSFASEMNGAPISPSGGTSALLANVTANEAGISINPLTEFVNSLALGRLASGSSPTLTAALSSATQTIEADYGLKSDPSTLAANFTTAGVGTDAGNFGLIVGALINEDQSLCPATPGGLTTALSADIADGVFDGMAAGVAVPYCGGNLPALAGTSDFQDALSGLQQLQLVTVGFGFGGFYGPAGNVLINQTPPVTPNLLTAPFATIDSAISLAAPSPLNQFATSGMPNMITPREDHTATLLPSGKVLIAGGYDNGGNVLNTAELYDPVANSFTAVTSTMSFARAYATATLLPNGKVLIAGGLGTTDDVSVADIYDPVANSFSPGPTMVSARDTANAILLPNGNVLIAGGFSSGVVQSSAELYDLVANSFTAVPGGMTAARYTPASALLSNGNVLIAGGSDNSGIVNSTDIYNPASNSFTAGPLLNDPREAGTATLLPNGKVLIAGGDDNIGYPAASELYDPVANSFAVGPPMNSGRELAANPVLLPNGKVLIAGGWIFGGGIFASTELYDPVSNGFAATASTASMSSPREFATATLLPNGKVLIAGGDDGNVDLAGSDLYMP
jgi:WD40 repeat protein